MSERQSVSARNSQRGAGKGGGFMAALGKGISFLGLLGLPVGAGMALGFWAADKGMRWLPTMLEILLGVCVASLLAVCIGRWMEGTAVKVTEKGVRVRKRVVLCLFLAAMGILAKLAIFWMRKPSPLTELPKAKFEEALRIDVDKYVEYDRGIEKQLQMLEELSDAFDAENPRTLSADEELRLRDIWRTTYDYAFALDQIRLFYEDWYRFDPSRAERKFHLRSFILTFAAELSLYEKSARMTGLITANPNAVKFLNAPDADGALGENSFSRFREELCGARDRARVVAGAEYLKWLDTALDGRQEASALGCAWLWEKAELEIGLIEKMAQGQLAQLTVGSDMQVLKRGVRRVWFPAQKGVAKWMGDTRVRRIGVYLISAAQAEEMDKHLEPGDILLSRKNWYLSNVGLPGFWPHAILYIGSPEKLAAYFDESEVIEYVTQLSGKEGSLGDYLSQAYPAKWLRYSAGSDGETYRVIEGIKHGILLNTFSGAMGDYAAVLRPRLSKKAKAQAIIEAFGHVDKPYDFDFDFATDHALVCTELVWRSYRPAEGKDGLDFELVDMAGRKTLPANEIARQFAASYAKPDRQLDFVYWIDASEKQQKAVVSTEAKFLESHKRLKWDIAQD